MNQVVRVVATWRARADALARGRGPEAPALRAGVPPPGSLDPEGGEVVGAGLSLATTADALVECLPVFFDQREHLGGRHRPHVNVVEDLEDGLGGESAGGRRLDGPTLSARVVVAGRSTILDYGTATRTIPAPLWNALVIRDRHCRFPDRPAEFCEGHLVVHVEHGGPTCLENLVLECGRHHCRLHQPGWHAKLHPDGTFEVIAADGRHWVSRPPGGGTAWVSSIAATR
ncbi:MAG TPA: HNH endonuclease [Acidimicrobiales bacterium]|nr:HNH endonuclease [Acidimicrobiales bacterium]